MDHRVFARAALRSSGASKNSRSAPSGNSRANAPAHALAQLVLLLVEGEVHPQPRGSPRRRSATTLRWISFVPA